MPYHTNAAPSSALFPKASNALNSSQTSKSFGFMDFSRTTYRVTHPENVDTLDAVGDGVVEKLEEDDAVDIKL